MTPILIARAANLSIEFPDIVTSETCSWFKKIPFKTSVTLLS